MPTAVPREEFSDLVATGAQLVEVRQAPGGRLGAPIRSVPYGARGV